MKTVSQNINIKGEPATTAHAFFTRVGRDPSPPTIWWKGVTAWGMQLWAVVVLKEINNLWLI